MGPKAIWLSHSSGLAVESREKEIAAKSLRPCGPSPASFVLTFFMTDPIARTRHTVRSLPSWPLPYRLLVAAAILTGLGLASLAIDLPVAQWCRADPIAKPFVRVTNLSELLAHRTDVAILLFRAIWKEFLNVVNFAEVFAQGTGVAILLFTVLWLDPSLAFPSLRWPAIRWPSFQPRAGQQNFARLIGRSGGRRPPHRRPQTSCRACASAGRRSG